MVEGVLGLRVGENEIVARAGDAAVVAPGTPHRFWNAGEADARFLGEITPALQFESLIETMFTLAAEGKYRAASDQRRAIGFFHGITSGPSRCARSRTGEACPVGAAIVANRRGVPPRAPSSFSAAFGPADRP